MKCINHKICHNQAAPGHALCSHCKRMAETLDKGGREEETLRRQETKPVTWRDVFEIGKRRK
jgi:hypothetical protein